MTYMCMTCYKRKSGMTSRKVCRHKPARKYGKKSLNSVKNFRKLASYRKEYRDERSTTYQD